MRIRPAILLTAVLVASASFPEPVFAVELGDRETREMDPSSKTTSPREAGTDSDRRDRVEVIRKRGGGSSAGDGLGIRNRSDSYDGGMDEASNAAAGTSGRGTARGRTSGGSSRGGSSNRELER